MNRVVTKKPPPEYYDNTDRMCRWCSGALKNLRQTRFDMPECSREYWNRMSWAGIKALAHKRDDWTCKECGVRWPNDRMGMQADHIVSIADGGEPLELDNVQTLCIDCHKAKTKAWHASRTKHPATRN